MDGKHVAIQAPAKSGSLFFNCKKSFNIVLLALCDASYQYTAIDIREAGRQSDGGVFANSNLGRSVVNDYFNLTQPKQLYTESKLLIPYSFVADDVFPMRHNLLKPHSSSNLEHVFLIFNYRLSRARRIMDSTFGIFAARFRMFVQPKLSCLETVEKACVALHNHLMANKKSGETNSYCLNGFIDQDVQHNGEWRKFVKDDSGLIPLSRNCPNNYSRDAKVVQDMFCDYFHSPGGAVPWQLDMVSVTMSK